MFNIGPLELMVILIVALLVVGPRRLPEVGRSVGRGLREFRRAQDEVQRSLRLTLEDDETAAKPAAKRSAPAKGGEAADVAGVAEEADVGDGQAGTDDIAKAIGRGLAELRKAREELQQSFRVDLGEPDDRRG